MKDKKIKSRAAYGVGEDFLGALKVNGGVLSALLLIVVAGSVLSPKFMTVDNMMAILRAIACPALCVFGMTFVILAGKIDLSVGSVMSLCGCMTSLFIARGGMPTALAIAISLLAGALCGALNGVLVAKIGLPAFIATLATMNMLRGVSYLVTSGRPVVFTDELFPRIGTGYIGPIPLPAVYMGVAFLVLWILLNRTRFGRNVYAVGSNVVAAKYSGVNTDRNIIVIYMISGLLSAFAGIILISRLGSGQPTIGEGAELDAIAACVVGGVSMNGGTGTLFGAMTGCLIIGTFSNLLNLLGVNSYVQLFVKGMIIVISVSIDIVRIHMARKAAVN